MTGELTAALVVAVYLAATTAIVASYAIPTYRRYRDLQRVVAGMRAAGYSDDVVTDLLGLLRVAVASDEGRRTLRLLLHRCGLPVPECLDDPRSRRAS